MEVYKTSRYWKTNYEVIQPASSGSVVLLDRCAACSACNKCMAGDKAFLQGVKMYCWLCFEKIFGLKCASCLKSIIGSNKMNFVFYNNRVWHNECFCCLICGKSLQESQPVQDKESLYCRGCRDK